MIVKYLQVDMFLQVYSVTMSILVFTDYLAYVNYDTFVISLFLIGIEYTMIIFIMKVTNIYTRMT